jgi:hypothetical protein
MILARALALAVVTARSLAAAEGVTTPCSTPSWEAAAPPPQAIYRYGFAQDGDTFYLVAPGQLRSYSASSDSWTTLAPMPRGLQLPGVGYHAGKLYVAGGHDDGLTNSLYVYDIASNTWSQGPDMPVFSYGSAAGVYGGKLFVLTGASGGSLAIFDIASGTWTIGPPPPVAYRLGGHAQSGQYLYLVGSLRSTGNTVTRRLDMASVTWSTGPAWTPGRGDFALASDGANLYAAGGRVYDESLPSAEVWDLALANWPAGAWTRRFPDLPSPREANQAGFFSQGRIWTTGGYGAGQVPTTEHLWLSPTPTDADLDGVGAACDCNDFDSAVWSPPAEVHGLRLSRSPEGSAMLAWDAVGEPGAATVAYDVLSSEHPSDFLGAGCLDSPYPGLTANSDTPIAPGSAAYFLVRASNACPGTIGAGPVGATSSGVPRTGRVCP